MISEELLGPTNLPITQILYVYKATKVIMIGEYKNFVLATF